MSGQIRLTPDQMRGRAGEVRNQGEAFGDVIGRLQNLINTLQTEWEGEASRRFATQFDALRPSFEQTKQLIYDIGSQLDATAHAVEQLDKDIASKFKV